jgi:hypothetical protein
MDLDLQNRERPAWDWPATPPPMVKSVVVSVRERER